MYACICVFVRVCAWVSMVLPDDLFFAFSFFFSFSHMATGCLHMRSFQLIVLLTCVYFTTYCYVVFSWGFFNFLLCVLHMSIFSFYYVVFLLAFSTYCYVIPRVISTVCCCLLMSIFQIIITWYNLMNVFQLTVLLSFRLFFIKFYVVYLWVFTNYCYAVFSCVFSTYCKMMLLWIFFNFNFGCFINDEPADDSERYLYMQICIFSHGQYSGFVESYVVLLTTFAWWFIYLNYSFTQMINFPLYFNIQIDYCNTWNIWSRKNQWIS